MLAGVAARTAVRAGLRASGRSTIVGSLTSRYAFCGELGD